MRMRMTPKIVHHEIKPLSIFQNLIRIKISDINIILWVWCTVCPWPAVLSGYSSPPGKIIARGGYPCGNVEKTIVVPAPAGAIAGFCGMLPGPDF
jgi:hypothetical protein